MRKTVELLPAASTNGLTGVGPVCDNCGDCDPDEYGNPAPNGEWLCESCSRKLVGYCEDCGGACWLHNMFHGPGDADRCELCHAAAVGDCED